MALLLIPEFQLKTIIDAVLLYIRTDYNTVIDKDDSYLAILVKGLKLGKYDVFEQAVEVFINRGRNHPKEMQCHLFFNSERASIPTIHIMLSEDNIGPNGIGVDEGYNQAVYNAVLKTSQSYNNRSFESRLSFVITSDNSLETIITYHIIRAALVSVFNDLQFNGLQNPKISGGTLNINPELVPLNIFYQAIYLDFFYDVQVPTIFTSATFADLIVQGIALNEEVTIEESSSSI
jgi:hypothetical protein